jgi:hypothetical protein
VLPPFCLYLTGSKGFEIMHSRCCKRRILGAPLRYIAARYASNKYAAALEKPVGSPVGSQAGLQHCDSSLSTPVVFCSKNITVHPVSAQERMSDSALAGHTLVAQRHRE